MENILHFPVSAIVDKNVPKKSFVDRAEPLRRKSLQDYLTHEFESINWLYKLAPSTLNVEDGEKVHEIDVFVCTMQNDQYSITPFCSLDDLLPRHTMFIIRYGDSIDLIMQHKELTKTKDGDKWTRGMTEMQRNVDLGNITFSIEGLNMDRIYGNLLGQVSGLETHSSEAYKEASAIRKQLEQKRKQIQVLQKSIDNEAQFNRQIDMNNQVRELKREVEKLTTQLKQIINEI